MTIVKLWAPSLLLFSLLVAACRSVAGYCCNPATLTRTNSYVVLKAVPNDEREHRRMSLSTRRTLLRSAETTFLATAITIASGIPPAFAFDNKVYPAELVAPSLDEAAIFVDTRARKVNEIHNQEMQRMSNAGPFAEAPVVASTLWAGALWLLSGSRSNPLATPLANVIYDKKQEEWLQDRNDGLFAKLPWEFLIILGGLFVGLGYVIDSFTTFLAEGDRTVSLQLAGVSIIGGCSLELGRIANGEKRGTRAEYDRQNQLEDEFVAFADARLNRGGNCHRNEVVRAFRRYYAKYRLVDSAEYPLSDLEIEKLLRRYCLSKGVEMSSAGFYTGVQINQDADVFAVR
jgi:hypothetical protein